MREKNWLTKIIVILVGSIISAYGITLAMYAGFGSATLAVLWQGVSKVTGMSIGMTSFVIAVVMIVFVGFMTVHRSILELFCIRWNTVGL